MQPTRIGVGVACAAGAIYGATRVAEWIRDRNDDAAYPVRLVRSDGLVLNETVTYLHDNHERTTLLGAMLTDIALVAFESGYDVELQYEEGNGEWVTVSRITHTDYYSEVTPT